MSTVLVPDGRGVAALDGIPDLRVVVYDPDAAMLPECASEAEILVPRGLDPAAALFEQLPRLRMVQLFSSGAERWENAVPPGVRVSNADGAHGRTVAEWVVAQLLCHYRDLASYRVKQAHRQWEAHRTGTLADRQVLVFGAGDIAEHTRRMLTPFGCAVNLVGRTARNGVIDIAEGIERLSDHDVVILAVPLNEETVHLADSSFLAAMRSGAVLVNAGRGALVDTVALRDAARDGHIHAILDVTDPEPLPVDHPLWATPGVVITPHAAGITDDLLDRCWTVMARKIAEFLRDAGGDDGPLPGTRLPR